MLGIPHNTIGFSTHEYNDWSSSMLIAYAKGARMFERHIDIESDGVKVSPYCTLPHQADAWFKAFHKAKEMCGAPGTQKRNPPKKEIEYLDALVRGVYAKGNLPEGYLSDRRRCLSRDPAPERPTFLPRVDAGGNVAEASEERCADYNRRYREPVFTNSITSSDDLPARSGRRQIRVTARTARPTAPGKRSL